MRESLPAGGTGRDGVRRLRTLVTHLPSVALAAAAGLTAAFVLFGGVRADARPNQGGPIEVETAVTIGIFLLAEVKEALRLIGKAAVYAKAKTDGPDADDKAVKYQDDQDRGLDWELDAAAFVEAGNNVDDGEEKPYTPGDSHFADAEIHFESTGGQWKPNPVVAGSEYSGHVSAWPDDDPGVVRRLTTAAAAAAFSVDGTSFEYCYRGSANERSRGLRDFFINQVDCSPKRKLRLRQGAIYLTSPGNFTFEDLGGDRWRISPAVHDIDLLHAYVQRRRDSSLFPLLRGYHAAVAALKRDLYQERVRGTRWVLREEPGRRADFTVVGLGLHLRALEIVRNGRSEAKLLSAYFASPRSVSAQAPEHAQIGYRPRVLRRAVVTSNQNLRPLIGRAMSVAANVTGGDESLVGVYFAVEGTMTEAVQRAINTRGHYLRRAFLSREADGRGSRTIKMSAGQNFHYELHGSLYDAATADPSPPPPTESTTTATTTTSGPVCDPSYPTVCIPPPPPDLSCEDIPHRNFPVGHDPHGFDEDHDGIGCETAQAQPRAGR